MNERMNLYKSTHEDDTLISLNSVDGLTSRHAGLNDAMDLVITYLVKR